MEFDEKLPVSEKKFLGMAGGQGPRRSLDRKRKIETGKSLAWGIILTGEVILTKKRAKLEGRVKEKKKKKFL